MIYDSFDIDFAMVLMIVGVSGRSGKRSLVYS
jgi:hypothetical protein